MTYTITGYSTALFSTWYFIEELGLLFDAGDGVTSSLLQKSRKIDHVFISHADRDHVTGLLKLNQLNARDGFPKIYFPKNARSFLSLEEFAKTFDSNVQQTIWTPIDEDAHIEIRKDLFVQSVKNHHVRTEPNDVKSLGFQVYQTKSKLKEVFLGLSQTEIVQAAHKIGKENMTYEIRTNILAYSGDTPVENFDRWHNTQILIHEATFLRRNELDDSGRYNRHSNLEDVLKMASEISIDTLILGHFSSRYSTEEIDRTIKDMCKEFNIKTPVYRVLPGRTHRNILSEEPIN